MVHAVYVYSACCASCPVRALCMGATLEVLAVLLAVENAYRSFPTLPRAGICRPSIHACSWTLSCEHRAGPAHLGVILDVGASYAARNAARVRVAKCADTMSSHARSLSVCALHIYFCKAWRTTTSGHETHGMAC